MRCSPTFLGYLLFFFFALILTCTVSPFTFSVLLAAVGNEKLTLQGLKDLQG